MSTLLAAQHAARAFAGHRPGSGMLFSSPSGAIVGSGRMQDLPDAAPAHLTLPAQVAAALIAAREAGHPDPIAIGALPFHHGQEPFHHGQEHFLQGQGGPGRLVLPEYVDRVPPEVSADVTGSHVTSGHAADGTATGSGTGAATGSGVTGSGVTGSGALPVNAAVWPHPPTVTDDPSPDEYRRSVAAAVEHLQAGALEKVVLARSLRVTGDTPADATALLANLAAANPHGHTFSIELGSAWPGEPQGKRSLDTRTLDARTQGTKPQGATLVGASPELLVSRRGSTVTAHPMAGSAARSGDPRVDRDRAEALLTSGKDRHEHAVVVDAVRAALAPYCARLAIPDTPAITMTPTMIHLATPVEGTLRDPATTALDLALALHPTPAVCGAPTDAARALIDRLEPFDRGLYAGLVGWTDADGDGEWVVTIRCGIVQGESVQLFAGAGIMAGSDPDAELAETTAKFGTLLRALGV